MIASGQSIQEMVLPQEPARALQAATVLASILAGFALPATGVPDATRPPGSITGYPSLEALLEAARRVQKSDLESWSRYRFKRQAVRAKLHSTGEISSRTDLVSLVTPLAAATAAPPRFDETLVLVDGVAPTPGQVKQHRHDAPFTRHYATTIADQGAQEEEGYSLSFLLTMSSYRHDGEESVGGTPCHRIRFEADEEAPGNDLPARFARAVAGILWITVDGAHLARASVHSIRPVDITFGVVRLSELQIEMSSEPLAAGSWVPRTIETRSTVRILGVPMRRLNRYSYSEFVPVSPAAPAGAAGR